jgi:hypothetical protein
MALGALILAALVRLLVLYRRSLTTGDRIR